MFKAETSSRGVCHAPDQTPIESDVQNVLERWRHWLARVFKRKSPNPSGFSAEAVSTKEPLLAKTQPIADAGMQEFTLASITLGLAATGAWIYPPLQAVCLPLLLYLSITPAQSAYRALRTEEKATVALLETSVLAVCIVRRTYVVGAFSYWCYLISQRWLQEPQEAIVPPDVLWQPPAWAWVEQAGMECSMPVPALRKGDVVVVHAGEMAPAAGVVTSGIAWVKQCGDQPHTVAEATMLQVGSKVEAATIVQVGCIRFTVL